MSIKVLGIIAVICVLFIIWVVGPDTIFSKSQSYPVDTQTHLKLQKFINDDELLEVFYKHFKPAAAGATAYFVKGWVVLVERDFVGIGSLTNSDSPNYVEYLGSDSQSKETTWEEMKDSYYIKKEFLTALGDKK